MPRRQPRGREPGRALQEPRKPGIVDLVTDGIVRIGLRSTDVALAAPFPSIGHPEKRQSRRAWDDRRFCRRTPALGRAEIVVRGHDHHAHALIGTCLQNQAKAVVGAKKNMSVRLYSPCAPRVSSKGRHGALPDTISGNGRSKQLAHDCEQLPIRRLVGLVPIELIRRDLPAVDRPRHAALAGCSSQMTRACNCPSVAK